MVDRHQNGTDIQGGTGLIGDPIPLHGDQGLHGLHKRLHGHRRQRHTHSGVGHALAVLVHPEHLDLALGGPVGLQTLKDLQSIVEHQRGGAQVQVLEGDNAGILPTVVHGPIHHKHVVAVNTAELYLADVGLGLERSGLSKADIHAYTSHF